MRRDVPRGYRHASARGAEGRQAREVPRRGAEAARPVHNARFTCETVENTAVSVGNVMPGQVPCGAQACSALEVAEAASPPEYPYCCQPECRLARHKSHVLKCRVQASPPPPGGTATYRRYAAPGGAQRRGFAVTRVAHVQAAPLQVVAPDSLRRSPVGLRPPRMRCYADNGARISSPRYGSS